MLTTSSLKDFTITATDGTVGTISDVLFDDVSWLIRWIEIDTGTWLSGRKVLLPPSVLGHPDPEARSFAVRLTRAEVEASPESDTHKPVSRQFEISLYNHYGWSPYWGGGFYPGGYGMMGGAMMMRPDPEVQRRSDDLARHMHDLDEPHLRSAAAVTGYHIHASDGEIGHLSDFLVEAADFSIHYLVVDTSNWWMGQQVLISPRAAKEIRWTERLVYLDLDRQTVKDSPPYDPDKPVDRAYERQMAGHYAARGAKRVAESEKTG